MPGAHAEEPSPDAPVLTRMPLAQIVALWRPGSKDWSWREEYAHVIGDERTERVAARIDAGGFGFHDHIAPVLLGSDGRVWDGHHRICIALQRDEQYLMVEGVPEVPIVSFHPFATSNLTP